MEITGDFDAYALYLSGLKTGDWVVPMTVGISVPDGRAKSTWSFIKKRMVGTGAAVAFVVLTTEITSLIGIINPAFSRIFLDRLLTGKNLEWSILSCSGSP